MDQDHAVAAIKTLIEDNQAELMKGLIQNELERKIESINDMLLGAATGYYDIAIDIDDARERDYNPGSENYNIAAHGSPYVSEYDVVIVVGDLATYDPEDEQFGRVAKRNFRKLCDRLVRLVRRDTYWIPSRTATYKYRLPPNNRTVRVRNLDEAPAEGGALIGAEITFTMFGCDD